MGECDEYQRRYARLREKMLNVYGWIQLGEEITVGSPNYQKFIDVRRELEQKFTALFSTEVVSLFQEFLENEGAERRESWENRERTEIISKIMLVGAGDYSDCEWEELKASSERIFLLVEEFGPLKVPTERGSAPAYEISGFWGSVNRTVAPHGVRWESEALQNTIPSPGFEVESPLTAGDPRPLTMGGDRADESIGFPQRNCLMSVWIALCRKCNGKLIFPKEDSSLTCPMCGAECSELLTKKVVLPTSSFVPLADTLHLREIWRSGSEDVRRALADSQIGLDSYNDYTRGALLSLLSLFLCMAAGVDLCPSNIAEVVSNRSYRDRLLERADECHAGVAHKLRGLGRVNKVAKAFWTPSDRE